MYIEEPFLKPPKDSIYWHERGSLIISLTHIRCVYKKRREARERKKIEPSEPGKNIVYNHIPRRSLTKLSSSLSVAAQLPASPQKKIYIYIQETNRELLHCALIFVLVCV